MGIWLILLFPDGRLPSPRWRWLSRIALLVVVVGTPALMLIPGRIEYRSRSRTGSRTRSASSALAPLLDVLLPICLGLLPAAWSRPRSPWCCASGGRTASSGCS